MKPRQSLTLCCSAWIFSRSAYSFMFVQWVLPENLPGPLAGQWAIQNSWCHGGVILADAANVLWVGFTLAACWYVRKGITYQTSRPAPADFLFSKLSSVPCGAIFLIDKLHALLLIFPETLGLTAGVVGIHLRNLKKDPEGNDSFCRNPCQVVYLEWSFLLAGSSNTTASLLFIQFIARGPTCPLWQEVHFFPKASPQHLT